MELQAPGPGPPCGRGLGADPVFGAGPRADITAAMASTSVCLDERTWPAAPSGGTQLGSGALLGIEGPALLALSDGSRALTATACGTEQIDVRARHLAIQARRGAVEEQQARDAIAAMLFASAIPSEAAQVLARFPHATAQVRRDVRDRLRGLIYTKCTNTEASSCLDLVIVADGRSVCGWARKLLRTAAEREFWQMQRHQHRERLLTEQELLEGRLLGESALVDGERHRVLAEVDQDRCMEALDLHEAQMRCQRSGGPYELNASVRSLMYAYGVPSPPMRLTSAGRARRLLRRLDEDARLAQTQMVMIADRLDGPGCEPAGAPAGVDPDLYAICAGWSAEQLRTIGRNPMVADLFVRAGASQRAPLTRNVIAELKSRVAAAGGGVAGSLRHAQSLASTYTRMYSQTTAAEWAHHCQPRPKSARQRHLDRAAFVRAARRFIDAGVTVFGRTPAEVEGALGDLVETVIKDLAAV